MSEELLKRIEVLEQKMDEEIKARKELARALIKLIDQFEAHTKDQMTLSDLQACLQKVNELTGILQSAGIGVGGGNGEGSLIAQILAMQNRQQQIAGDTAIHSISSGKIKKLKKLLEEDDDDEEQSKEDE